MSNKNSLVLGGRPAYFRAQLSIALALFLFATYGWHTTAATDADSKSSPSNGFSRESKPFDADDKISIADQKCASLASVRWLPHSNLNLSYARGDFTDGERSAFHQAVILWQKALALTQVGIVLNEIGEVEKDAQPTTLQIIVKRDNSMDDGHAGRILAAAGADNYLHQGFILINGASHKRDTLKKTMLHELGHGFGLRDCPNCRSGATVMNYFLQRSLMGIKLGKGSARISNHPTEADISQVASGYLQSPPAVVANDSDKMLDSNIVIADEAIVLPGMRSDISDDNIVAPYLKSKLPGQADGLPNAPVSALPSETNSTRLAASNLKIAWKPAATLTFAGSATEMRPPLFALAGYAQPSWKNESRSSFLTSVLNVAATDNSTAFHLDLASESSSPTANDLNVSASLSSHRTASEAPVRAGPRNSDKAVPLAVGSGARSESALSTFEKTEFESYVPTLLEREAETIKELNDYTFHRDVLIQTIDSKGGVSGEYHRISDLLFDDSGGRIERGVSSSKSTLRRLKISPEYLEDFSGAQLKGFELANRDHYRIEPFMADNINGISMRVYRITPLNLNVERDAQARAFYGFAWVDEKTGKIFKIKGCALPDDKQRFPMFETQRELIDNAHLFPVRTIADDYLVFPSHTIHVRMLITYTNYKRFASRVSVIEVDSGR